MKTLILALILLFSSQTASAKTLSRTEIWKKASDGASISLMPQGLSKREVWSIASGKNKNKAPKWAKSKKKKPTVYDKHREMEILMDKSKTYPN